jgi:hypothetical protein
MANNRNRVIYAGTDVLVSSAPSWSGQTEASSLKLLKRVQSSAISINNPVTRAKQIGSSNFAFEKYITQPEIKVDLNYLITDNSNELILGLNATGNESFIKNLAATGQDRNLFFLLSNEGAQDADSITSMIGYDVFAIGNAFLSDYSIKASVGSIPSVSTSFECLNIQFQNYNGTGINPTQLPAIDLTNGIKSTGTYLLTGYNLSPSNYLSNQTSRASALRPGDITMELEQPIMGGIRYSGTIPASINSIDINIPINRKDLIGFGSNYPFDKKILYPLIGTISFNGIFDQQVVGDFSQIFYDENEYDMSFNLKKNDGTTGLRVEILNARVESQSFNLGISENMTFQSSFSFKIFETDGFRISGAARLL